MFYVNPDTLTIEEVTYIQTETPYVDEIGHVERASIKSRSGRKVVDTDFIHNDKQSAEKMVSQIKANKRQLSASVNAQIKRVAVCPICGQSINQGQGFEDAGGAYRHEWC